MKNSIQIHCNLCSMVLPNDEYANQRMKRHSIWHSKAWIKHRNTTQGHPKYYFKKNNC
jgi:hypothetical protein